MSKEKLKSEKKPLLDYRVIMKSKVRSCLSLDVTVKIRTVKLNVITFYRR